MYINLKISEESHRKLKILSLENNVKIPEMIEKLIEDAAKRETK